MSCTVTYWCSREKRKKRLASFPGLPTVQFLITCSMQKGGGRAGPFYHVNDVSVYLGRQGSPIERMHFTPAFTVLNQGQYIFRFMNIQNFSCWGRKYKINLQACSFDGAPPPSSVYLDRHWRHSSSSCSLHFRRVSQFGQICCGRAVLSSAGE